MQKKNINKKSKKKQIHKKNKNHNINNLSNNNKDNIHDIKSYLNFKNEYFYIAFRYLLLLLLIFFFQTDFFNNILIVIFTFISYLVLKNVTQVDLLNNSLLINNEHTFLIVEECIAPSAYILISFIFLSLPIDVKKNFSILLRSLIIFTIINLIRILLLMLIHIIYGVNTFEQLHLIFYEGVSGIILVFIIIYYLKKEKIKKLYPIITDIKKLVIVFKKKD
jgi:exosortase/archaeosortase family protein